VQIDHIRSFLEAAAWGSFFHAAQHLNVSQSTVSARIKALEERVGTELFIRNKKGVTLSESGKAFHRYAMTMIRAWDQAQRAATSRTKFDRRINVGIQESVWPLIATSWLKELNRAEPSVQVRLVSDVSRNLVDQMCDGLLDLAVTWEFRRNRDLHVKHLIDIPLILVSSTPITWTGALPERYIYVEWGAEFRAQHDFAFGLDGVPEITAGFASNGLDFIMETGGAAYFMKPYVSKLIHDASLHRVVNAPTFARSIYVGYPLVPMDKDLLQLSLRTLQLSLEAIDIS
jgi:DNA-binding transcriptional LysR family regulator